MLGEDENVQGWYEARAGLTPALGARDAILLDPQAQRAAGPFGDTAHLVVEWHGTGWFPVAVADSYAEAYRLIVEAKPPAFPQPYTPVALLRRGSGRHRKN